MAPKITVSLVACVAGNPLKAWIGTTGPDDVEHVPDDVWEDQTHAFPTIEAARAWIETLHPDTSTHVRLYQDDELIFDQDAGDDLYLDRRDTVLFEEAMAPGITVVPEAPPLASPPGGTK